jgi:hypothetical protein
VRDSWVRTIRTAVQVAIASAAVIPLLVPALGLSATVGVGAALVGAAAVVTRVMAIPVVHDWVNKLLRAEEK